MTLIALQLENARLQICDVRRLRQKSFDLTATRPIVAGIEPTRQLQKEGAQHYGLLVPAPPGWPQGPYDTGGGGSGCPPGPAAKVSGDTASCWPTPGLLQSHTPPANTACSRAHWAALKLTGA